MRMFIILSVVLCMTGSIRAETIAGQELSNAEGIVQDMSAKLCRGTGNALTGWGELIRQPIVSGYTRGWWAVLPVGIPAGALMTVVRTGVGVFEIGTFIIPMNDSYGPLMNPTYVWQKERNANSD